MSNFDEHIQALNKLGLTTNQGKLYLTLLRTGKKSGSMLSRETKLARQEVYRLLNDLQEKGLVEKIISAPLEFQAVPIQNGTSILMMQKATELSQAKQEITNLIKEYSLYVNPKTFSEKEYKFVLIPGKDVAREKRKRMLENAKENIRLITTSHRFRVGTDYFFESSLKALKKNVNFRIIVQEVENMESVSKYLSKMQKYPNFEIQSFPSSKTNILIIDDKEAIVTLYPKMRIEESPILWTDHPGFIEIYQDYFETLWNAAKGSTIED